MWTKQGQRISEARVALHEDQGLRPTEATFRAEKELEAEYKELDRASGRN
jgi:hypothetical protein